MREYGIKISKDISKLFFLFADASCFQKDYTLLWPLMNRGTPREEIKANKKKTNDMCVQQSCSEIKHP